MTSVRAVSYGPLPAVELAGDRLRAVVCPAFGGRVVSLTDPLGHEWLVQGPPLPPEATAADAAFGREAAVGWDECLPTVSPARDPGRPTGRLRDHGDVWGRPLSWELDRDCLHVTFDAGRAGDAGGAYAFLRSFVLEGRSLEVRYALESRSPRPLALLWSMHPLLALEAGSRLILPGVESVVAGFAAGRALAGLLPDERPRTVPWPTLSTAAGPYRLDTIPGPGSREALKLYAGPLEGNRAAAVAVDGGWLGFEWSVDFAPYLGIWLSHGAWPDERSGGRQAALEPTTAPTDDLATAIALGSAVTLEPGGRRDWWARLSLGSGPDSLAAFLRPDPAAGRLRLRAAQAVARGGHAVSRRSGGAAGGPGTWRRSGSAQRCR